MNENHEDVQGKKVTFSVKNVMRLLSFSGIVLFSARRFSFHVPEGT